MAIRTLGVAIDGATGRLGTTQHLRALLAMRDEGGLPLANGDRADAGAGAAWPQCREGRGAGGEPRRPQMEHRYGGLSRRSHRPHLFRRAADRWAHRTRHGRVCRRQACLCRKAGSRDAGRGAGVCPGRRACRAEGRCRAGQDLPARPAQAAKTVRSQVFRPGDLDQARIRLVGVRRRSVPVAAGQLELPQRNRRRADPRYVRALALCVRPAARADRGGIVPPHHGPAKTPRRGRAGL